MTFVDQRRCRIPGCPEKGRPHQHHVVYRQEVRREGGDELDPRNALTLCTRHHDRHHTRQEPVSLLVLRDENYAFARELLGSARAYEYLRRRYAHEDGRLEALLPNEAEDCTCKVTGPAPGQTRFDPGCRFHGDSGSMVVRFPKEES